MCSKVDMDPKGNAWVIDWYVIIMMKTIPVMIVRFLQWLCIFCVNSSPIPKFQRGINSETLALSQIKWNVVRNTLHCVCIYYFHNIITECEEQPHAINYCHCTYISDSRETSHYLKHVHVCIAWVPQAWMTILPWCQMMSLYAVYTMYISRVSYKLYV